LSILLFYKNAGSGNRFLLQKLGTGIVVTRDGRLITGIGVALVRTPIPLTSHPSPLQREIL
jgi:hypothetical protein